MNALSVPLVKGVGVIVNPRSWLVRILLTPWGRNGNLLSVQYSTGFEVGFFLALSLADGLLSSSYLKRGSRASF